MSDLQHLLVVDDDPGVRDLLRRYFAGQGFSVSTAANGGEMRRVVAHKPVDVVLLDLGLPGEDGFELTRQLRRDWNGALIIITGRGESVDRVVGLELGADDYVTKPFDLRELLARVRSVLRRSQVAPGAAPGAAPAAPHAPVLHFSGFRFDPMSRTLSTRDGSPVTLTSGEFDLLRVLLDHPHRVLSRDELMDATRGRSVGPFDRAIDVQVGRLRRKLGADPAQPELIKSIRGAGYMLAVGVRREEA